MSSRRRRRRNRSRSKPRRESRVDQSPLRSFLRRRSTRWLVAAILTLAVGISLGVLSNRDDDEASGPNGVALTPTLAVSLPEIEPAPALLEEAEVLDVIDGDTIDVRVGGRRERIRYFGVDTPERGDRCYNEATERNEALAGDTVRLLPDVRERDPNDRLLRYVFTEEGASVEARLIAEGLGAAWRADGAYRDELVALETAARAADAGCLWGEGG